MSNENMQPDERAAILALARHHAIDHERWSEDRIIAFARDVAVRATQQATKGDERAQPSVGETWYVTHKGASALSEVSAAQVISDLLFSLTERRAKNVIRSEDAYVDAARAFLCRPNIPEELHPDTKDLVRRFASALAEKLLLAQQKYGYSTNWARAGWADECRSELLNHVHKGDPRDVAAYCAFLWHHEEPTSRATTPTLADLHKELNKITWMGSDDGWDRAIKAVRARIIEMLSEGK